MRKLGVCLSLLSALIATALPGVAFADEPPAAAPPPPAASPPPAPVATSTSAGGVASQGPSLKGVSVWGILPWGGIGAGGRFMFPLPIKSLLQGNHSNVRDSFAFEAGADLLRWSYGFGNFNYSLTEIVPVAGVMWNVWLNDQLALYPKVELGYVFYSVNGWQNTAGATPTYTFFFWDAAGGAMYKLNNGITLRGEIGYAGLKLGAGWLF